MAVKIPTQQELYDQILADIAAEFNVDVNTLGFTYRVRAQVEAAIIYNSYLSLSGVQKNIYYDLAEESILIRYGVQILGRKPAPAEAGEYTIEITGQIGATITSGTTFRANDNTLAAGSLYVVDANYTLIATTDIITVRSLNPGTESALQIDDLVTSTSPIADVNSEAIVTVISKQPTAGETISEYRDDIIQTVRIEPQGGSAGDFRLWCLEIPEIRTVYPYQKFGSPGDVEIYVEATPDNTAPAQITGVPTQSILDDVYTAPSPPDPENGIVVVNPTTGNGRKPIGVFNIEALPVTPIPVDVDFTNITDVSIASSLRNSLDALLYNIRPFVAGADITSNKNDILTIGIIISTIVGVLAGTGISYTNVTMDVDSVTVNEYQFLLGYYPYLRYINNNGNPI